LSPAVVSGPCNSRPQALHSLDISINRIAPGASTRVRRRIGHPLDSPARGRGTGRLLEALGGQLPPAGRAGAPAAPAGTPLGGGRGRRGPERLTPFPSGTEPAADP